MVKLGHHSEIVARGNISSNCAEIKEWIDG